MAEQAGRVKDPGFGRFGVGGALAVLVICAGCATGPTGTTGAPPTYDRPLPAGRSALFEVPATEWPGLVEAFDGDRGDLLVALNRSLSWFAKPSSHDHYPVAGVTHARARASVYAFRDLVARLADARTLAEEVRRQFELHASSGWDGRGSVLFTGYYAPVFPASRQRTDEYRYPLYRRPEDLVTEPGTGRVLGRRTRRGIEPYPTRAEIESSNMLAGHELVWLSDRFDLYLIHLQGSAALRLPDGSVLHVGYAGNNGHEYVSVARELLKDGKLAEHELSGDEVRAYFDAHPGELEPYLHRNPRYIFFREVEESEWPTGALGVPVTPLRSLATDKEVFPPGAVVLVDTRRAAPGGSTYRFRQFMVDQDAGGGIRAAGRADIYFGVGAEAGAMAARQYAQGRMYYLVLKPERAAVWQARMGSARD